MLRTGLPVVSTALFYAVFYLVSAAQFDVHIAAAAVPFDYLLQLLIAYFLFALSRRVWVFVVLQGLLMGVSYVGNAVKIAFFGGPIMPDDAYALRSLLLILEGWNFIAVAVPLAAIAALMLFNITLRHWSSYLSTVVLILLGVTLVYQPGTTLTPLDRYFGNSVWDQRSNYLYRGATRYTLQEGARYFADAHVPPDRDPDAIILVFGDHLPFLGMNFAGYVDSGVLAAKRSQFSADMFRFLVSTPMIVIDGQRGPLKTGTLPMYRIPTVLLELLNITEPTIMDYTRAPQGMQVRPLAGLHINLFEGGEVELCREPPYSAACQTSARCLEQVRTINDDLFIGEQFTRSRVQSVFPAVPDNAEHGLLQQEL